MSKAVEQLLKERNGSIYDDVNTMDAHEISPIAYTVETSRGEHPSLQSKRSLPAANRGPCRLTDSPWPLLYAELITIPLMAIYLQNPAASCGIF